MRRAPVAAILALLLALAAGLVPAAAPGLPVPTVLGPGVALAADDIEITTATRYTVDPGQRRVHVSVDVTAVNRKPNRVSGGTVTRYFYDGVNIGVQPEARGPKATQEGAATRVSVAKRKGFRLVTVHFHDNIYFGQTARVRLTFELPGGAPRSSSDVRVGSAFSTFMAWAFGDAGTVRVEVPSSFRVETSGSTLEARPGAAGFAVYTASTSAPLGWYAWINATDERALARDRLALAGGDEVIVRGWPEDAKWRTRVRTLLRDGVPELSRQVGLPWPVHGALTVTEVHTPLLEGYAGFYDSASDTITISEDLDELTIVHEASHAWFNKQLFSERWITEGLADEYAARVILELGLGHPGPKSVKRAAKAAFPLADWAPPAPIKSHDGDARERYGYDASWLVMRSIVRAVGAGGMRAVFAAAADGTTAYRGSAAAERTGMPNDWRRFLDLADELGAGTGVEALLKTWVLDDRAATLLPARAAARKAYAGLEEAGGPWAPPVVVRMAMDRWAFPDATAAIADATGILATRDEIAARAIAEGLAPDAGLQPAYEAAASPADLVALATRADESLAVLDEVVAAADAVKAPRDWLATLGLEGSDPQVVLDAARHDWEAGDLAAARTTAADAAARVAAAPAAGRARVMAYGAGGTTLVLVIVGLLAVFVVRRRGASSRRASPGAATATGDTPHLVSPGDASSPPWSDAGPGVSGTRSLPAGAGPYATLPPDGPPGEPSGGPTSGDEGADRS